jgi:hypothetical protein
MATVQAEEAVETPAPQRAIVFAALLLAALVLRADTFGDPNLHGDEVFYFTVGTQMHHGVLPYVDVWDRKPLGLFILYYLIAGISTAPLAYQLAATLCAAGTAFAIATIAQRWTTAVGGLLAGLCYLMMLAPLQGFGGQSPVFYDLFVAVAALLVLRALPSLRAGVTPTTVAAAMLLAGIAITMKTTALFEGAYLGLAAVHALWRSGAKPARLLGWAALWAALGAAPTLAISATYALNGHWPEYWQAMVTSNLAKPLDWRGATLRIEILLMLLAPLLVLACLGLLRVERERGFLVGWLVAAIVGLCAMPNFYSHYAIPLTVPLCIAASAFLARQPLGLGITAALAIASVTLSSPFQYGHAEQSRRAIETLAAAAKAHVGEGRLLLYDAPPQLYQLAGQPFITPLVFPTHLSHLVEKDVSPLSTLGETRRVLAGRPGAVVMAVPPRNGPVNEETHRLVLAYVGRNCRLIKVVPTLERLRTDMIAVWGDCRR